MLDISGGLTMRNRVINGCCRVMQRGTVSLTTSNQFGPVDRMMGSYVNGSAGTLTNSGAIGTFKRGVKFNGVTLASGYITFRHRIEALNTLDLSGQTVTVSALIYHEYGSSTNFKIGLRKASASDNFSSTSAIGTDTTVAVGSATATTVSGTYTLGSTDGDNGIEIVIYHDAATVTTKNVVISDIQLTLGSEVEQLERRSYGTELALCQRYLPAFNKADSSMFGFIGPSTSTTRSYAYCTFPVPTRVSPTGVSLSTAASSFFVNGTATNMSITSMSFIGASLTNGWLQLDGSGNTVGQSGGLWSTTTGAQILFTGCEL